MRSSRSVRGFSMVELMIGLLFTAICALSMILAYGKLDRGRVQNVTRTKGMSVASSVMEMIRGLSWDEWAVNNSPSGQQGRSVLVPDSDADGRPESSSIGPDVGEPTGVFDDVDDADGYVFTDGPFSIQVDVTYVNAPVDGSPLSTAPNAGKGTDVTDSDKTHFKWIVVKANWAVNQSVTIKTLVANGR